MRNLHNDAYMSIYEKGKVVVLGLDGSANIFVKRVSTFVPMSCTELYFEFEMF